MIIQLRFRITLLILISFSITAIGSSFQPFEKTAITSSQIWDGNTSSIVDPHVLTDSITVYVYFVVDKKGKVKKAKAQRIECDSCDEVRKEFYLKEAEKKVVAMPKWKPARDRNGKPRESSYMLPVKFDGKQDK